jgi:hypothetical protein
MNLLDLQAVTGFVNSNIDTFHVNRIQAIQKLRLREILKRKNPYLFRAKNSGQKSSAQGIDLEFNRDDTRFIVAVKSGPNWGNSSQYQSLRENFKRASKVLRQSDHISNVQAVLGMCYRRSREADQGDYIKMYGQRFWEFISGQHNLYIDIVEPLGFEAKRRNETFEQAKDEAANRLIREFMLDFCDVPRDRNSAFEPQIIRKYETSSSELEDKILGMYAKGMSTRDISATL